MPMRGLYALKPWYTRRLSKFVDGAVGAGTSPDLFTALGVVCAALAGGALAMGWWPVAFVLLAGRLAGANLDGAVARARGVSRPWGFVLNEIGDRTSDLFMFAGLAVLAARVEGDWTSPATLWVCAAALAATLPTFASLTAAGAGGSRLNGGPFGKTERCATAVLACAIPAWLPWLCALVIAGSLLTAGLRLTRAHRDLAPAAEPPC